MQMNYNGTFIENNVNNQVNQDANQNQEEYIFR